MSRPPDPALPLGSRPRMPGQGVAPRPPDALRRSAGAQTRVSARAGRDDPTTRQWFAVAVVALGVFAMVTAEQMPVGLLTSVGSALDVSEGTAGLMVTVPGLVAAIAALLVPVAVGRLDRRVMLVGLVMLMAAASLLSALAPNFELLLASRVLIGLSIGGFWSIAGGLASRLTTISDNRAAIPNRPKSPASNAARPAEVLSCGS